MLPSQGDEGSAFVTWALSPVKIAQWNKSLHFIKHQLSVNQRTTAKWWNTFLH